MKKLLYLFLLLTSAMFAQDVVADSVATESYFNTSLGMPKSKVDSMEYDGKMYYIYPYILEAEYTYVAPKRSWFRSKRDYTELAAEAAVDYAYDGGSSSSSDIPPVLDSLPEGDYLLLQNPTITKKNRKLNPQPLVRAIFSVKRGLLNGLAVFYNTEKEKSKEGAFANGIKEGEWKAYYWCNGKQYYDRKIYVKGVLSGPFKECNCYDTILYDYKEGRYENGEETGEIKKYGYDSVQYLREHYEAVAGQFTNYYYVYNGKGIATVEVNALDSTFNMDKHSLPSFEEEEISTKRKKKKHRKYYDGDNYQDDYGYWGDYSLYISVPTGVPFVIRYESGQLYGRFKASPNFESINQLNFDTLYRANGKIGMVKRILPDTLSRKRYSMSVFDSLGKVRTLKYYASAKTGNGDNVYETWKINDQGQLALKHADYTDLLNVRSKKYTGPSLVLLSLNKKKGALVSTYYSTILKKEFKKVVNDEAGFKVDFKITTHDTLATAYEHYIEAANVKAVVYSYKDTSKVYKPEQRRVSAALLFERMDRNRGRSMQDSLVLYKDGKPFTGRLNAGFSKGDQLVKTKDNEIKINLSALAKASGKKMHSIKKLEMARSYAYIDFVDGRATYLDLRFREGRRITYVKAQLKNSVPEGKMTFKQQRVRKGIFVRLKEEGSGTFSDGMPDGTSCSYRAGKHGRRFLEAKETFDHGIHVDTSYHYYDKGKIESLSVYDKQGKIALYIRYDFKTGKMAQFEDHRNSETVPAVSYELNEKGDTTLISTELNGKKHGRAYYLGQIEGDNFPDQLWLNYKDGNICGQVIYKDNYGIKRLELKVDSSYSNPEIHNYDLAFMMNSWKEGACFDFAGDVTFYHPTRQPFFTGKMAYSIPKPAAVDSNAEEIEPEEIIYDYARVDSVRAYSNSPYSYKTGLWTYYDPQGIKLVEVNYNDTTDLILAKDTVRGIASYKAFYENGQLRYTGRLLEETSMLDCESDLPERDFTIFYDSYFAKDGSPLVKKGTGNLKIFYNNEMVRYEGEIVNGKENGWWKEYNKDGKLISAGKYKNGVKQGRWLYGDLTGINYLDDRCFESEDMKLLLQSMVQYTLEIREEVYENGEIVKEETYTFRRAE